MSLNDNVQLDEELDEKIQDYILECLSEMRPLFERIATEVSEKVFQEKFSKFQNVPINLSTGSKACSSSPPLPTVIKGTRKHVVPREKLSGTVDASLFKLFEDERKQRGYNISRMLDVVLWTYFSITTSEKPRLSFESSDRSHDTE
ncbi:MAG: hypothetical protein ACLPVO_17035 [Desulfomonilaceae bacterium]